MLGGRAGVVMATWPSSRRAGNLKTNSLTLVLLQIKRHLYIGSYTTSEVVNRMKINFLVCTLETLEES